MNDKKRGERRTFLPYLFSSVAACNKIAAGYKTP